MPIENLFFIHHQIKSIMKKTIVLWLLLPCWMLAQTPHKNVLISTAYAPNEPTIALDPNNPKMMLAGSNIRNLYSSKDGGLSWSENILRSTYGVWGDPVIIPDTAGNFYFFHLSNPPNGSWIDRIVCQKTSDYGKTWTNGSYMGLNGKKAQDKHWAIVDRRTNYIYVTWTQFDKYDSPNPKDKSSIMFSMSKDEGASWTPAKKINEVDGDCLDSDNTTEGAVPAIGPDGQVYVAWTGPEGLVFDKSLDGGKTWLDKDIAIDPMPGGWDYKVSGIYRTNGLPVTVCDLSGGKNHGTIYVNWTDQRNGEDNTDVWLAKSTDEGETWSKPIRVNTDSSERHQFFSWMAVDQTNGYLYFVFYDRRNTQGTATEVYMARSTDGGQTFTNFRISASPFKPNPSIFFGDYTNIVAQGATVRPIWTRLDGTNLSIYTAIVDTTAIGKDVYVARDTSRATATEEKNSLYISFKLHKTRKLKLAVTDANGKKQSPIFKCKKFAFGKHIEKVDLNQLDLPKGRYTFQLKYGKHVVKAGTFEIK